MYYRPLTLVASPFAKPKPNRRTLARLLVWNYNYTEALNSKLTATTCVLPPCLSGRLETIQHATTSTFS